MAAIVDSDLVRRVARLARLRLDRDHEDRWVDEFSRIVAWVDVLEQLDDAPPAGADPRGAPLRSDQPEECGLAPGIVDAFPERDGDLLVVPAVLEGEP